MEEAMFMENLMKAQDALNVCTEALEKLNNPAMQMSIVCTLFDFVCDTNHLDKRSRLVDVTEMIANVNGITVHVGVDEAEDEESEGE